jgi:hypothetical protein
MRQRARSGSTRPVSPSPTPPQPEASQLNFNVAAQQQHQIKLSHSQNKQLTPVQRKQQRAQSPAQCQPTVPSVTQIAAATGTSYSSPSSTDNAGVLVAGTSLSFRGGVFLAVSARRASLALHAQMSDRPLLNL